LFFLENVIISLKSSLIFLLAFVLFIVLILVIVFIIRKSNWHISGSNNVEKHLALRQAFVGLNLSLLDLGLQFSLESKQVANQLQDVLAPLKLGFTDNRIIRNLLIGRDSLLRDFTTLVDVIKDLLSP